MYDGDDHDDDGGGVVVMMRLAMMMVMNEISRNPEQQKRNRKLSWLQDIKSTHTHTHTHTHTRTRTHTHTQTQTQKRVVPRHVVILTLTTHTRTCTQTHTQKRVVTKMCHDLNTNHTHTHTHTPIHAKKCTQCILLHKQPMLHMYKPNGNLLHKHFSQKSNLHNLWHSHAVYHALMVYRCILMVLYTSVTAVSGGITHFFFVMLYWYTGGSWWYCTPQWQYQVESCTFFCHALLVYRCILMVLYT